ncbi:MAG TPA: hypothetical protein VIQ62_08895 [Burkholderiales bacterium]
MAESVEDARAIGRIRVVAAYFAFCTVGAAAATVFVIIAVLFPRLGWHTHSGNSPLGLTLLGLLSFGFARTYLLLRRYRRSGAYLAVLCLAGAVAEWIRSDNHQDWFGLLLPALGLALLVAGWRELE